MLTLEFSSRDLVATSFALSPMKEVVASILTLKDPGNHAIQLPWVKDVRNKLPEIGHQLDLLMDLVPVPCRYIPSFLTPSPDSPVSSIEEELATLRATPAEQVRADLERLGPTSALVAEFHADPVAGLSRLVSVVERYWSIAIAPYWPRMRMLLEGEVVQRSKRLADGGASLVFRDLASNIRWADEKLHVTHMYYSGDHDLGGRGLLLVPSIFVWPSAFSNLSLAGRPTLTYSCRGVAALWEREDGTADFEKLVGVIGRSRALLLAALRVPASTKELAEHTGLSGGGVSQHLTALRSAGFVAANRAGRIVLYSRTVLAELLIANAMEGRTGSPVSSALPEHAVL